MDKISHDHLLEVLTYEPETGLFRWKAPRPKVRVGQIAGSFTHHKGYVLIEIYSKSYAAHRLAWFYMTGQWPADQIDHINRIRSDNRFENLREATNGQNQANSKAINKHGLKGIRRLPWMKETDRCWQAIIGHNKKTIYLGCFHTKEEAYLAYCSAANRFHGEFSHH